MLVYKKKAKKQSQFRPCMLAGKIQWLRWGYQTIEGGFVLVFVVCVGVRSDYSS